MAKKSSKRNCKDNKENKKKKQSSKKSQSKASDNDSIKFSDFTYAELIVLSSTLAYSIGEELDEEDLEVFAVFLGLLIAELQLIVIQKQLNRRNQSNVSEEDLDIEDIDVDY